MPESFREFFSTDIFMPHGHCYLWKPALLWLQILANGAIGLAYVSIFATLVYLVRRIRGMPFQWMYVAFAIFIVSCGITHFFDVYVIWNPAYWLDSSVRVITATASIGTAIVLPPLVPRAVALAEAAAVAHQRGLKLEDANKQLAFLLDKTQELEQLKTQFFANVSHELRTPLTLILGPTEKLLAGGDLTEAQRHDLDVIGRNARTLLKHVNDLLDVSKLEAGKVTAEYVETDLAQLVRRVTSNFDGLATERSISYSVEAPERLSVQVDADKLQRVILNLLSNAFKFTPRGGRIRCSLREGADPSRVVLEVADSGPGVRAEHRTIIFERFRQVENGTRREFGGTGLGLAIAKDFVELQGGTIAAGDAPEGGALFTVELPIKAPASVQVRPARPAAAGQARAEVRARVDALATTTQGAKPLVLVVEDNPEMNRYVCETLALDYETRAAFNGQEGLRRATDLVPDLIVSDVMMPLMGGGELVREVRARSTLGNVPIMLLTAKADDELRIRLLREGAQDYLMKPFSADELRARVANLVKMKRARDVLQQEFESQQDDIEALAHQVTSRKRELQIALDSTRVARDQAQRASQLKTSFLGMVSHELRTPITALELQLERLRRDLGPLPEGRRQHLLQRMSASAARLAGLIEALLQHAQIESGRLSLDVKPFDLRGLVVETVDELRPRAEQKGLELRFAAGAGLFEIQSDPRLVRIILINLVENALKFTEHGFVEVSMSSDGGIHRLVVRDTGPGIAPEAQVQVFEPFTQLEELRAKHLPGVGLGLALVKEMAEALGGRVELTSQVGVGSTFTVRLPLASTARGAQD